MRLAAASENVEQEIDSRPYLPHPGKIPCVYIWINSSGIINRPILPSSVRVKIALYCTALQVSYLVERDFHSLLHSYYFISARTRKEIILPR